MHEHSDVFSFYKEELARETITFVHERAVVTQKDIHTALSDVADDAVNAYQKTHMLLGATDEKAKAVWDSFVTGFVAFHLNARRYKLTDILVISDS